MKKVRTAIRKVRTVIKKVRTATRSIRIGRRKVQKGIRKLRTVETKFQASTIIEKTVNKIKKTKKEKFGFSTNISNAATLQKPTRQRTTNLLQRGCKC
jgi:hypothetical protein